MIIRLPKLCLVALVGPSGSGKSTFARRHFKPTEVLSSDTCRAFVSDDDNNQAVSNEAFAVLHFIAAQRLTLGKLTVVDATNVQPEARAPLVSLARQHDVLPVAIVLNMPEALCQERNSSRGDRTFGPHVVRRQKQQLRRALKSLYKEGFRQVHVFDTPEEVETAVVERVPLWNDLTHLHGPFDIIGDIHGCGDELEQLLAKLGYIVDDKSHMHPAGRQAVFVGDIVDRGPRVLDCLRIVRTMVEYQRALCVPGNHDVKLLKHLQGRKVQVTHGLAQTLAEIEALPEADRPAYREGLATFLDKLVSHYVLDDGKLVVAHAGLKAAYQSRASRRVRDFCLYGETTGETDEFGLPVRHNWAAEYRGSAMVVYGHTPVPEADWLNHTVNIDTGCVFGGKLTALRYPELEFVAIPAHRVYCEPARPFLPEQHAAVLSAQQAEDQVLDAGEVMGKRIITTRLKGTVTIRETHATAALEVMSRFAANPQWLIYLPPTMSPCETSHEPGLLEHPAEAFQYFRNQGVPRVICEEKHMGSRAIVIVCKDDAVALKRFGVREAEIGIVYTRTGRRFFNDAVLERAFLDRLQTAMTQSGLWETLHTDWICLDAELLPWSAKAQELLKNQYAAVGAAGRAALAPAHVSFAQTALHLAGEEQSKVTALLNRFAERETHLAAFTAAYRHYCWPVGSLDDLKLAPFYVLASEGKVYTQETHQWHMETLATLCQADPKLLRATPYRIVDVTNAAEEAAGIAWWTDLTAIGGEGMVVKPLDVLHRGPHGLTQPAVKCRGREYLRIIYGPDYSTPENLTRLRHRGLGHKRSLALSEFALGMESLERFIHREPLRRVHECVFGVLALESEPVDPRL